MKTIKENYVGVCVSCGAPVPEGRMICPNCEKQIEDDAFQNFKGNENRIKNRLIRKGGKKDE